MLFIVPYFKSILGWLCNAFKGIYNACCLIFNRSVFFLCCTVVSLLDSWFGLVFRNKILVSRICFLLGSHSFKAMPNSTTTTILCLTIIVCRHFQSQWLHVEAATDCWKCGEISNHIKLSRKKKEDVHSLMRKIKTLLNHAEHLKISKNKK